MTALLYIYIYAAMSPTLKYSVNVTAVLDKTRRGAYWIRNVEYKMKLNQVMNKFRFLRF